MAVPGIIGARLFYVVQFWSEFSPAYHQSGGRALLAAVLNISQGGLVVYGSFFGGMIGLLVFIYLHRFRFLALVDLIAPSMMLGLAIGRIGCLLHGCCFGEVCHEPWAITFPTASPPYESQVFRGQMYGFSLSTNIEDPPILLAVEADSPAARAGLKRGDRLLQINGETISWNGEAAKIFEKTFENGNELKIQTADQPAVVLPAAEKRPRSLPVHPTQIYSSIDAFLICLLLLAYAPFQRRDGVLFALMASIYGVSRFLIEMLRSDEAAIFGTGMHISQNISLLILIAVAGLWVYIFKFGTRDTGRRIV
jgi:phosphatidylglycerol:prolipoprotein diacylglycerol transferase